MSNETVKFIQTNDFNMSCSELQAELKLLGTKFSKSKEQSGISSENIAMAIFYWPGIISNELQSSRNKNSIQDRVSHITPIYESKCANK